MGTDFFTLDDFDLKGKTVLLRVDINSPIDPATGQILNDSRLREHLVTIRDLRDSKVAMMAHQSRPGKDDFTTLEAHADRLGYLLGKKVRYIDSLFGSSALSAIEGMKAGDVILLENTRFYSEEDALADEKIEKMAKTHIVKELGPLADYFVLDAFAAAHRAQPTLVGFCEVLPTLAGRVMEKELRMLGKALHESEKPSLAIFGGIKADDSIAVMKHMLDNKIVDKILTTGAVANLFLLAKGIELGKPSVDFLEKEIEGYKDLVEQCKDLLKKNKERIEVPKDVVLNDDGKRKGIPISELPSNLQIYDVGLDTIVHYEDEINKAKTIILNGPAGVFEMEEFSVGTRELFNAVADANAFTVVGGGHTVAAVEQFGLTGRIDHVSTGGGALINYLAGKPMPLVEALKRSKKKFSAK